VAVDLHSRSLPASCQNRDRYDIPSPSQQPCTRSRAAVGSLLGDIPPRHLHSSSTANPMLAFHCAYRARGLRTESLIVFPITALTNLVWKKARSPFQFTPESDGTVDVSLGCSTVSKVPVAPSGSADRHKPPHQGFVLRNLALEPLEMIFPTLEHTT